MKPSFAEHLTHESKARVKIQDGGHTALLPPVEQLPVEHNQRVREPQRRRGLRRCDARL